MRIWYQHGDLLAATEHLILHGCNAQGVMGRGVAAAIKQHLPFAYDAYRRAYERNGLALGDVIWAIDTESARIVGNLITQEYWQIERATDGRNVDYVAVCQAFRKVAQFARMTQTGVIAIGVMTPITHIAMPRIGSGLGGGAWPVIASIIESESTTFQPVVYTP